MMIAIPLGITPLHFGIDHALPDGLLGYFFVIIPFFLSTFAVHANGFMVYNGQDSRLIWRQFLAAALTLYRAR
jgi:hypothetical protein